MKSKKNLTRFTYETTAFQGWRLCISRGGQTFMRYFSDKPCQTCGGERLRPAELLARAEAWRPWRAYAALLIWGSEKGAGG